MCIQQTGRQRGTGRNSKKRGMNGGRNMEQWEEILRVAREIARRRGKVYARQVCQAEGIFYSQVWTHALLKKMTERGLLEKAPGRGGFTLPRTSLSL